MRRRNWPALPYLLELRRWMRWRYFTHEGWHLRSAGRHIGLHLRSGERFAGVDLTGLPTIRRERS